MKMTTTDISAETMNLILAKIEQSVSASVSAAVGAAMAESSSASNERIIRLEEQVFALQRQLDDTHRKYDDKFSEMQRQHNQQNRELTRAVYRLHGQLDKQEMMSWRFNVCIENIPFDCDPKAESD